MLVLARVLITVLACTSGNSGQSPADSTADTATETPRGPLQLRWPLLERELFTQTVGVDHDPTVYDDTTVDGLICTNYDGRTFPWCYDGHLGSDYLLDGGFSQMDNGSATIVAAADGTVIEVVDGHYDRCHGEIGGVSCDGNDGIANDMIVEVTGSDGLTYRNMYWHLMNGSPMVAVGDVVTCGQPLGLVGSSGNSSQPHLHFEVQTADPANPLVDGTVIDPYAGVDSQPETWWVDQGSATGLPASDCPGQSADTGA